MNAVGRMTVLNLRTVVPYRNQWFAIFAIVAVLFANRPVVVVPALVLFLASAMAVYPFNIGDKAGLDVLYAVLPLSRRAVVFGHYVWALACFLVTAGIGTGLALVFGKVANKPLDAHTLALVLTVSWVLFALNVAIPVPLLIRFGYTRVSVLSTTVVVVLIAGIGVRLHVSIAPLQAWLPLIGVGGAVVLVASAAVAVLADRQRALKRTRT